MAIAPDLLAGEIDAAFRERHAIQPPSGRDDAFDLSSAYAVERSYVRRRAAAGHQPVGRKVGFANKAAWRVLKLDTVVWAHMYDDTVQFARNGQATLQVARMLSPKIEPEIVFKLARPLSGDLSRNDAAGVLAATGWLALGFEIIDCPFPDWVFKPEDFVAAAGLHAALVVGTPTPVTASAIETLVGQLPTFKVRLAKDGQTVEEGTGRNSLRSPALCVAELSAALARQQGAEPLAAGELISSGTLTASHPIVAGERWSAEVEGLALDPLQLHVA